MGTGIRSLPSQSTEVSGSRSWSPAGAGAGQEGEGETVGLAYPQLALLPFPPRPGPAQETGARKNRGQWVQKAPGPWNLGRGRRGSQDHTAREGKAGVPVPTVQLQDGDRRGGYGRTDLPMGQWNRPENQLISDKGTKTTHWRKPGISTRGARVAELPQKKTKTKTKLIFTPRTEIKSKRATNSNVQHKAINPLETPGSKSSGSRAKSPYTIYRKHSP